MTIHFSGRPYDTRLVSPSIASSICGVLTAALLIVELEDCTIAIINKNDLSPTFLPGMAPQVFQATDVASYINIYESLLALTGDCMEEEKQVGWALAG